MNRIRIQFKLRNTSSIDHYGGGGLNPEHIGVKYSSAVSLLLIKCIIKNEETTLKDGWYIFNMFAKSCIDGGGTFGPKIIRKIRLP